MFIYDGVVGFCAIFGFVYELFGHGVFSTFMMHGFAIPLVLGMIPYTILFLFIKGKGPGELAACLYNSGIATLTVGSYFRGVLEIYGTSRVEFYTAYFVAGLLLLCAGIGVYIVTLVKRIEE